MSKAKELATNVIIQMEEIQRQVMNNNSLSGFTNDWQSGFNHAMTELRNRLNDAVLSEPDEQDGLKGWIQVTYTAHSEIVELIPINKYRVVNFNDRCAVIPIIDTENSSNVYMVKESYDEIKQKIRESSWK